MISNKTAVDNELNQRIAHPRHIFTFAAWLAGGICVVALALIFWSHLTENDRPDTALATREGSSLAKRDGRTLSGETSLGSNSEGGSRRSAADSFRQEFEDALSDPARVRELFPRAIEDRIFVDRPLFAKFLKCIPNYPPEDIAFVLNHWPNRDLTRPIVIGDRVVGRSEMVDYVWEDAVREFAPESGLFDRAHNILKHLKPDDWTKTRWIRYIASETPSFSLEHIKTLKELGLSESDRWAIYNVLMNSPKNIDEGLYEVELGKLLLDR